MNNGMAYSERGFSGGQQLCPVVQKSNTGAHILCFVLVAGFLYRLSSTSISAYIILAIARSAFKKKFQQKAPVNNLQRETVQIGTTPFLGRGRGSLAHF